MRTNHWFETKLDRVLAEAGTKMTDSMHQFISAAYNELMANWGNFYTDVEPGQDGYYYWANPFPGPPWNYDGQIIVGNTSDYNPDYNEVLYLARVTSPDGVDFGIQIAPTLGKDHATTHSGVYLRWPTNKTKPDCPPVGIIHLNVYQATSKANVREIIAHEVTHVMDPKERRIEGTGAKQKRENEERKYTNKEIDYNQQSHEIDAIMTSNADRRLNEIMTPDATPTNIQNAIRNLQPQNTGEKLLFKYGQWKRYLQTIYRFAQQRQQND